MPAVIEGGCLYFVDHPAWGVLCQRGSAVAFTSYGYEQGAEW